MKIHHFFDILTKANNHKPTNHFISNNHNPLIHTYLLMLNLARNELLVITFNSSQDLMTFPNVRNNVVLLHQNVS
jgi:hypothetical protein